MRAALEEQSHAIDLIMTKHRVQVHELTRLHVAAQAALRRELDREREQRQRAVEQIALLRAQISQMAAVMRVAADQEDAFELERDRELQQLRTEVATLRNALASAGIAATATYGSSVVPRPAAATQDAAENAAVANGDSSPAVASRTTHTDGQDDAHPDMAHDDAAHSEPDAPTGGEPHETDV